MTQTIDLRCCYHGNFSQLLFTNQIRRQVKSLCPKPRAPSDDSCSSDVTVTLTEVRRTGSEQPSAEIVYCSDDTCVDIYLRILIALRVFERQSRNLLLPLLLSLVPRQLEDLYDRFIDRELFHIAFVRNVAQAIGMETGADHDHTKDAFYAFVTCGKFGGVGADGKPEFEAVFTEEVDRHLSLEPHHPQFEHFRQMECRDCDIQEMAVDRLSRNTVAANGHIDRDRMALYLPQFELGDVDRKLALYKEMALRLESIVVKEYHKLKEVWTQDQFQAVQAPQAAVLSENQGHCCDACLRAKIQIVAPNKFHIELQSL